MNGQGERFWHDLAEVVRQRIGLQFVGPRRRDLVRGAEAAARDLGLGGVSELFVGLLSSDASTAAWDALIPHLTVGETYFFREPRVLDVLRDQLLPERIAARRAEGRLELGLWSAGCASGEEPATLAIIVRNLLADHERWRLRILGTDVNGRLLEKARRGVYTQWSLRGLPAGVQERYLEATEDGYRVTPAIRGMIRYQRHNLLDSQRRLPTGGVDVVLCRNVLMYFGEDEAREVIARFWEALCPGGWLVTSPIEASVGGLFEPFEMVFREGVTLYRKADRHAVSLGAFWPWPGARVTHDLEPDDEVPTSTSSPPLEEDEAPMELLSSRSATWQENPRMGALSDAALVREQADRGDLHEALSTCDRAIARNPLDPALHFLRASILDEQGRVTEGVGALRKAVYLDPRFIMAHLALAHLYVREGKMRLAERQFEMTLSLLRQQEREEVVPESEGLTAGRLDEMVSAVSRRLEHGA